MSRILRAGGFTPVGAIGGDPTGIPCASCGSGLNLAWVHIASMQVVCSRCLPSPDDGAGERMAKRLTQPPAELGGIAIF